MYRVDRSNDLMTMFDEKIIHIYSRRVLMDTFDFSKPTNQNTAIMRFQFYNPIFLLLNTRGVLKDDICKISFRQTIKEFLAHLNFKIHQNYLNWSSIPQKYIVN
ncbi:hypothetical protein RF11_00879 [Thelohanellus kitauei]|uniref:Uncharacterized protein n=1 Tax=Thelohanellus kitauei TaxID=669202 RepID=A0A0C2MP42_THEKT|nr:hypothetical protein RF11_00879 [Thelohanellus kitauei]